MDEPTQPEAETTVSPLRPAAILIYRMCERIARDKAMAAARADLESTGEITEA